MKKFTKNRNKLGKWLFLKWNTLTKDEGYHRTFSDNELKSIRDVWGLNKQELKKLSPNGSTKIWFESLYVTSKTKESNRHNWDEDKECFKKYVNVKNEKEFMAGVMECLKYNFEPFSVYKQDGTIDVELIAMILPNIYRKPLYRKFGKFHGVQELNINYSTIEEEIEASVNEFGNEKVIHPVTGKPVEREEFSYILVDPLRMSFDHKADDNIRVSDEHIKRFPIEPQNTFEAFHQLVLSTIPGKKRS